MEVLAVLEHEDDNPRGRGVAAGASSGVVHRDKASLAEAEAKEAARKARKAARKSWREQEEAILSLMTAKSIFARLRVGEPSWDETGKPVWQVSAFGVHRPCAARSQRGGVEEKVGAREVK